MHLDDFVKDAVSESIQMGLRAPISDAVTAMLKDALNDPTFQEHLENMVTEGVHQALTPREQPEHKFKNVAKFVDGFIRPHYATTKSKQDQANWSKRWYEHPEVVARLDALWRTYERMRATDKEGFLESFLRNHADYHMKQIMSDNAVFASCSHNDTPSVPLPVLPPKPKHDPAETTTTPQ
ncbi:MAG: DUF4913 domain-containing protein [Corynebacterium casei]|nr:DUF4913 domain-containing protein [Corynebacterium casei]